MKSLFKYIGVSLALIALFTAMFYGGLLMAWLVVRIVL